jgi:tRNA(fMet)-specific endonuclease VapC
MKLLDSDHCVAILRGRLDLSNRVAAEEELALSAISVGELVHGAHKSLHASENLARLDVLLSMLVCLPYDEVAARRFGLLKAHLERAGETLSDPDLQIACVALVNVTPLVTHNLAHFQHLSEYGLQLEDWLA